MKTEKEIECDICKNVLDGSKIYEAGKSELIKELRTLHNQKGLSALLNCLGLQEK